LVVTANKASLESNNCKSPGGVIPDKNKGRKVNLGGKKVPSPHARGDDKSAKMQNRPLGDPWPICSRGKAGKTPGGGPWGLKSPNPRKARPKWAG